MFAVGTGQWAKFSAGARGEADLYYFTHAPPHDGSSYRGAYHVAEIAHTFDNVHFSKHFRYAEDARNLADTIANYWLNFAKTGNPNGEGPPKWSHYDQQNEYYVVLENRVEARQHLLKVRLDLLETARWADDIREQDRLTCGPSV